VASSKIEDKGKEAWRIFDKIVAENPDFNESKVIDYVAAVMGTNTDSVNYWLSKGHRGAVKQSVTSGVNPETAMEMAQHLWNHGGTSIEAYETVTGLDFSANREIANELIDMANKLIDSGQVGEQEPEPEKPSKEEAAEWLRGALQEYGNTSNFPAAERAQLNQYIEALGNTYFWANSSAKQHLTSSAHDELVSLIGQTEATQLKRRYFQDGGYNPTLVFDTLAQLMDDTPTDAFVDRLEAEWYGELDDEMGAPVAVGSSTTVPEFAMGTQAVYHDSKYPDEPPHIGTVESIRWDEELGDHVYQLTEPAIGRRKLPRRFHALGKELTHVSSAKQPLASVRSSASAMADNTTSNVFAYLKSYYGSADAILAEDSFTLRDAVQTAIYDLGLDGADVDSIVDNLLGSINNGVFSSGKIPIQQDLKGMIAMIKNWLQRVHEGLMERSVFYTNLMRLLKGNGYPGSKANTVYEEIMAGTPVEAVLASVKRLRSSALPAEGFTQPTA
jgi:hypothetical protein